MPALAKQHFAFIHNHVPKRCNDTSQIDASWPQSYFFASCKALIPGPFHQLNRHRGSCPNPRPEERRPFHQRQCHDCLYLLHWSLSCAACLLYVYRYRMSASVSDLGLRWRGAYGEVKHLGPRPDMAWWAHLSSIDVYKCRIVQGHKCIKWFKCSLKAKANQVLELFSLSLYHARVSLAKLAKGVCTPAFDGVVFIQQHTSDVSYRARDLHADRSTLAGKWLEDAAMFVPSNYAIQPWNLSNSMYPVIALEMGPIGRFTSYITRAESAVSEWTCWSATIAAGFCGCQDLFKSADPAQLVQMIDLSTIHEACFGWLTCKATLIY